MQILAEEMHIITSAGFRFVCEIRIIIVIGPRFSYQFYGDRSDYMRVFYSLYLIIAYHKMENLTI